MPHFMNWSLVHNLFKKSLNLKVWILDRTFSFHSPFKDLFRSSSTSPLEYLLLPTYSKISHKKIQNFQATKWTYHAFLVLVQFLLESCAILPFATQFLLVLPLNSSVNSKVIHYWLNFPCLPHSHLDYLTSTKAHEKLPSLFDSIFSYFFKRIYCCHHLTYKIYYMWICPCPCLH